MIKKTTFIMAIVGLVTCSAAFAQSGRQEIGMFVSGGLSTLDYKANVGKHKNGAGGGIGVNYNYYLTENWSLLAGVELSCYNSKLKIDEINDFTFIDDAVYKDVEFRNHISNFEEEQHVLQTNIPVMAQYEKSVFDNSIFYAAAGVKLNIPVYKKSKIESMSIYNRGFYPELSQNGNEIDEPQYMGYGHFSAKGVKENIKTQLGLSVTVETGLKWPINNMFLYTGVYCDYGLTNLSKKENKHLINYNDTDPEDFNHTSALNSKYSTRNSSGDIVSRSITKDVKTFSLGVKLRLSFNI